MTRRTVRKPIDDDIALLRYVNSRGSVSFFNGGTSEVALGLLCENDGSANFVRSNLRRFGFSQAESPFAQMLAFEKLEDLSRAGLVSIVQNEQGGPRQARRRFPTGISGIVEITGKGKAVLSAEMVEGRPELADVRRGPSVDTSADALGGA